MVELVDIKRRLTGPLTDRRRMVAIAALVLGLAGAWFQTRDDSADVQVSLLLTHAQVQLGDTTIEYQGLREVIIRVPAAEPGQPPVWRMALSYAPGQVPKVTPALSLSLPEEVDQIEVLPPLVRSMVEGSGMWAAAKCADGLVILIDLVEATEAALSR